MNVAVIGAGVMEPASLITWRNTAYQLTLWIFLNLSWINADR